MSTIIEMTAKPVAALSGAGLPWELHEACAAWPEMSQLDLRALADDIAASGLRDPVTLTPEGLLLDGRNRALACIMAGVEPNTVVYAGDPVLFSLSRNKHRRHLSVDQVAMVAARLVTTSQGGDRRSEDFKTSNEGLKVGEAAKVLEVPKTAVESACVVVKHGTPEEVAAVEHGRKRLRKTADDVRARKRGTVPPRPTPKSVKTPPDVDPIEAVACAIISTCADGKWRSVSKVASAVKVAEAAAREALKSLGDGCVALRKNDGVIECRIDGDDEAFLRRSLAVKDQEIANLKNRIAEQDVEIERLRKALDAPSASIPPTRERQRRDVGNDIAADSRKPKPNSAAEPKPDIAAE